MSFCQRTKEKWLHMHRYFLCSQGQLLLFFQVLGFYSVPPALSSVWNPPEQTLWCWGFCAPSSAEELKFCQSEKSYFGSCASHSRRNWTHSPVFCEKYINDKGLWKVTLQFVAWPFPQWWEMFPVYFRKEADQDFDKYCLNNCTELGNKTGHFCYTEIRK